MVCFKGLHDIGVIVIPELTSSILQIGAIDNRTLQTTEVCDRVVNHMVLSPCPHSDLA